MSFTKTAPGTPPGDRAFKRFVYTGLVTLFVMEAASLVIHFVH